MEPYELSTILGARVGRQVRSDEDAQVLVINCACCLFDPLPIDRIT